MKNKKFQSQQAAGYFLSLKLKKRTKAQQGTASSLSNRIFVAVGLALFILIFNIYGGNSEIIDKDYYSISPAKLEKEIAKGDLFKESFFINNKRDSWLKVSLSVDGTLSDVVEFESEGIMIGAYNTTELSISLKGKEAGEFLGNIILSGDITERIPIKLSVLNRSAMAPYSLSAITSKPQYLEGEPVSYIITLKNLNELYLTNVSFSYFILDMEENQSFYLGEEVLDFPNSGQVVKNFVALRNLSSNKYYTLVVNSSYGNFSTSTSQEFFLSRSIFSIKVFGGISIGLILAGVGGILTLVISIFVIRYIINKKKKYRMSLDYKTLPKPNDRSFWFGKIAETAHKVYYNADNLTTHSVVAGATGGGKSISAQVIIEEALMKNIAVVVFDPTAQWSGMLRKCDDKKMLSFYPNFGLKPSDARAFPGNLKFITNSREYVDLPKYIAPGHIHIFALNKLTPQEIDLFVANTIASIFKSGPDEYPGLRVLFVFDEVHRLLPKFGGSGKGFLQIERACREFRKWGYGIMLVSQVLSDFVGEIKANINTELQMRTRDEADLNRIKTKYGTEYLQSLIKASVGVGMFVNPAYNLGKPFFIAFRPILHNTRRLTDQELEKYNHYNEIIDDIEYQIQQLEAEKIDTFDLKMELKLVKDKLMTGAFTVVDIYLEGLLPRLEKQWQALGKKPKKKEIALVDELLIKSAGEDAAKARSEWDKTQAPKADEKKAEAAVNPELKIVKPITFDNGMMISSLKELKDVLPTLDEEIFGSAVNDEKNDIAKWVSGEIDPALGKSLEKAKKKDEMLAILSKPGEKKEGEEAEKKEDKEGKNKADSKVEKKEDKKEKNAVKTNKKK